MSFASLTRREPLPHTRDPSKRKPVTEGLAATFAIGSLLGAPAG